MKASFGDTAPLTRIFGILMAVLLTLPLHACYLAANGKAMEQRVQKIEDQQEEFGSTFERTRGELTELVSQAEQQVSSLRQTLQEARKLLGDSSATLGVRVDNVEAKIAELNGQLDSIRYANEQTQEDLETLKTDIEFRLEQLER